MPRVFLDQLKDGHHFRSNQFPEGTVYGQVEFEAESPGDDVHVVIDGEHCVWPGNVEVELVS